MQDNLHIQNTFQYNITLGILHMKRTAPSRRIYDLEKDDEIVLRNCMETENGVQMRKVYLGEYKFGIEDVLGQGFSSTVYKAIWRTNPKQKYAMKVIDLKKFKHDTSLALLDMEVEIVMSLRHPNIIECVDVFKTKTFYYLAFEYCPHGDLQELIKFQKCIPEDRAIDIMKQVIAGYKHMMGKSVIHRDLKPANIMRFGNKWKIGDFGFARYCKDQYVLDKVHVGTPLYLAPESLSMSKYSFKGDLFALGVIFYQMLTGETPWPCKTEKQLLKSMMSGEPVQIPEGIICQEIRDFLKRTLEVQFYSRMAKDQFKKFSLDHIDLVELSKLRSPKGISPFKRSISKSGSKGFYLTPMKVQPPKKTKSTNQLVVPNMLPPKQKSATNLETGNTLEVQDSKSASNLHTITKKEPEKLEKISLKVEEKTEENPARSQSPEVQQGNSPLFSQTYRQNAKLMYNEIDFLRFIMDLIHNIHSLLLDRKERTYLVSILYRFCIIDLRMLASNRQNILRLDRWDTFKKTERYQKVVKEVEEYLERYGSWLSSYEKEAHKSIITLVNEQIPEYSEETFVGCRFYAKLFNLIRGLTQQYILKDPAVLSEQQQKKNFYAGICQLTKTLIIIQNRTQNKSHQDGIGLKEKPESCFPQDSVEMKEYEEQLIDKKLKELANIVEEEIVIPEPPPMTLLF